MKCDHCGQSMYWYEQWTNMICVSWQYMEGGCPFPTREIWGDWSWRD